MTATEKFHNALVRDIMLLKEKIKLEDELMKKSKGLGRKLGKIKMVKTKRGVKVPEKEMKRGKKHG